MATTEDYSVIEADSLTRHAVCLGMTGSGKTGLCVAMLEELAMAGVPVFIIDPKGDMANLALAFADHKPADFLPWIDPAAAKRENLTPEQFSEALSAKWKAGLAEWQVGPDRVRAFTDGAKVTIYTPGSTSGTPVDVLGSLAAPPAGVLDDDEGFAELVSGTVASLLALVGVSGDPITDPAFLVLGRVIEDAWRAGTHLELGAVITGLVDPPFEKIGVFPVDTFFPRAQRVKLAMQLNGLVASPAFAPWSQGVALDPEAFLAPVDGKTPISVFYLAHLDEERRAFFIAQLLHRVVAWSRRQPGTSSLRALVYFDEVYGYLPPYPKNPPTKKPVLTLMKQARAVGIGTMLVTQNPVDLDYAALANAGLWMIGRLQTAQDREKVLDGLAAAGGSLDRATLGDWIGRLPPRTFVIRDANSSAPTLLKSRQAITYLRGPLTKREIEQFYGKTASTPVAAPAITTASAPPPPGGKRPAVAPNNAVSAPEPAPKGYTAQPPPGPEGYAYSWLNPDVVFSARLAPVFAAYAASARRDEKLVYLPALYARLHLTFDQGREFSLAREEHRLFFPLEKMAEYATAVPGGFVEPAFEEGDLADAAPAPGFYAPLPTHVDEAKELKALSKRVIEEVLRGETEQMFRHAAFKLDSRAGETREDFKLRVVSAANERADAEIAKMKDKVDRDLKRIEDKRVRLEQDLARKQSDASSRQMQEVVGAGAAIYNMFFGRRSVASTVTSAVSKRNASSAAAQRAGQLEEQLTELQREIYELDLATDTAIEAVRTKYLLIAAAIEAVEVKLKAANLSLDAFGIVWIPVNRTV